MRTAAIALTTSLVLTASPLARQSAFRTLNDKYSPPRFTDAAEWKKRAAYLREHILATAGLVPMPDRAALAPEIFGKVTKNDYTVEKVYFQSLPGFLVTGNLYRPIGPGPFPAVLAPHGHWAYGRLENTTLNSVPGRAINLARQGFVVFTYDMIGYDDSRQLPHTFGGKRETLWGMSLAGLQLWNSIRSLDFLQSLPDVQKDALAVTGESGGGTQTFLLAAVDDRVKVAVPVNMISLHMQGGCLCENAPTLRLDTNNVEIAATIAPRPLLMVSATGDWTANTLEAEYPAVRAFYSLLDAPDQVSAVRFKAEHNYNKESREAMYGWLARWMKGAAADVQVRERSFTADSPADLLVFHQRALPAEALSAQQLTENWIAAAKKQLSATDLDTRARALRHSLGFGDVAAPVSPKRLSIRTVLTAGTDQELDRQLRAKGFRVQPVTFTPFDAAAAAKIRHFETYNRTAAAQRVADIVVAVRANPSAALVAAGDNTLAAILASAVVIPPVAILEVGDFDTSDDAAYVEKLYVPGLRRAGDLDTAAAVAGDAIVIHGAGDRFALANTKIARGRLDAAGIVQRLKSRR
jgi:BAAT / Acyl-CoA thioester hydrolase C terminal